MTLSDFDASLAAAVNTLRSGGLIALPTETLYALAVSARDATAVQRVFEIKGREAAKPLPLFVSGLEMAEHIGVFDEGTRRLAARFWPGPLTIVVNKHPNFDSDALAGASTVAVRAPNHALALGVVSALDEPITGTSANLSGGADPDTAQEVQRQLGDKLDLVIDGGTCRVGTASTIVDCTGGDLRVLRQGVISEPQIREAFAVESRSS